MTHRRLAALRVAFVAAGLGAVDQPTRASAVPRMVPPERLPAAIALGQLNFQFASIVGPAIGGVLIATVGLAGAYTVDLLSFVASLQPWPRSPRCPRSGSVTRPSLEAIREGLRYARDRRAILGSFVIDLNAMIFGMPTSLFPVLALDVFDAGPAVFGLLVAAPGVGAFIGAFFSGWVTAVTRVGRAIVLAVIAWGLAILAFGLCTFSLPLALVMLAVAGAADVFSAVFRSTLVQTETPDQLRGRVTSIHTLVVTSGPRLGDIEAALVAAVIGPQLAVISGGILCVAGVGVIARRYPELASYTRRILPSAPGPAAPRSPSSRPARRLGA